MKEIYTDTCPLCDGTGVVTSDIGLPIYQDSRVVGSVPIEVTCEMCKGSGVVIVMGNP